MIMQILIVEDSKPFQVMLKSQIENMANGAAWTCEVTDNLSDALAVQHQFDTVILDLTLRDSDQENTIRHIPEFDGAVVICSASDERAVIRGCIDAGAKGFVSKGGTNPVELKQSIVAAQQLHEIARYTNSIRDSSVAKDRV